MLTSSGSRSGRNEHADHRGEMEHVIHAIHRAANGFAVENRSFNELMLEAGQIMLKAGAQIIEHAHIGFALEMFNDMTANKTGAACDQDFHADRPCVSRSR